MPTKNQAKQAPAQYATKEEFNELVGLLSKMNDKMDAVSAKAATPAETKEAESVRKAKPDSAPVPESWDEAAREIIGEALDHVEMLQPRGGGTLFTVIIKPEFSNAGKEYLERHKADRRTKEIGSEGIGGVEAWCKLVKQNLKRPSERR
jgi:hypothetical protein